MKAGAYVCTGCGIGECLDAARLTAVAMREGKLAFARQHPFLCGDDGVRTLRGEIGAEALTHLVIAACSRRAKTEAFDFPALAVARANLREGVAWAVGNDGEHDALRQELADDYVRMACAEAKKMQVPAGHPDAACSRRILVVGGGVSGMTAAIAAAQAGYDVVLVEKTAELGGWARQLWKRAPCGEPFAAPEDTGLDALSGKVRDDPRITLHLSSAIRCTRGAPGRFEVDIAPCPEALEAPEARREDTATVTETVGAIVQASGFTTYDLARLPELGGGLPFVTDHAGVEALAIASQGGPLRRADAKPIDRVVFIQCAGQRDGSGRHLSYCSGHCCATSVKQAMYFKAARPDVETVVLYSDLRLPGMGEEFYRSAQRHGITFVKAAVTGVHTRPSPVAAAPVAAGMHAVAGATGMRDGGCVVQFRDLILDVDASVEADLVVLATGQVPNAGVDIARAETSGESPRASVLHLAYRQGEDVPQLAHGFADSHFICFPYETRRTGIYAAGPVRRPMDMAQAMDDATGAALKAIQAVENAERGRSAHPRSGDLSYPIVRLEGCTQCKRCTVECPFGAIDEDEKRYPVFNPSRCRRCGTCMGACPVRVISFENYSIDTVGAQIKAVDMPDEFSGKPRILVLACENDAYPALDMAAAQRHPWSAFVRVIPVRCLGSVNTIWITDALNGGWDGVMLLGCRKGDDYQCHFVKGSEIASERLLKINDTLIQLGLEPERVASFEVAITDLARVPQLIDAYVARIVELGMSPMKGFA